MFDVIIRKQYIDNTVSRKLQFIIPVFVASEQETYRIF